MRREGSGPGRKARAWANGRRPGLLRAEAARAAGSAQGLLSAALLLAGALLLCPSARAQYADPAPAAPAAPAAPSAPAAPAAPPAPGMPFQAVPGQGMQGQPMQGQYMQGQNMQGQPMQGQGMAPPPGLPLYMAGPPGAPPLIVPQQPMDPRQFCYFGGQPYSIGAPYPGNSLGPNGRAMRCRPSDQPVNGYFMMEWSDQN